MEFDDVEKVKSQSIYRLCHIDYVHNHMNKHHTNGEKYISIKKWNFFDFISTFGYAIPYLESYQKINFPVQPTATSFLSIQ